LRLATKVPARQALQVDAPVAAWKKPALQLVQELALTSE
jgi:hypothetical protein